MAAPERSESERGYTTAEASAALVGTLVTMEEILAIPDVDDMIAALNVRATTWTKEDDEENNRLIEQLEGAEDAFAKIQATLAVKRARAHLYRIGLALAVREKRGELRMPHDKHPAYLEAKAKWIHLEQGDEPVMRIVK